MDDVTNKLIIYRTGWNNLSAFNVQCKSCVIRNKTKYAQLFGGKSDTIQSNNNLVRTASFCGCTV